jgi:hypothetical protein
MITNRYTVGTLVVIQGVFTGPSGPIDPTDARVDVRAPDGITETYAYSLAQVVRLSVGTFTLQLDTTGTPGRWGYRWWSPAPVGAANQGEFIVDPFPLEAP